MKRQPKIVYWRSLAGWFWHLRAGNGRIICDGCEAYASKQSVLRAIYKFKIAVFAVGAVVERKVK